MKFHNLVKGTIIKRYKRFLADVVLEDGKEITVYVPNTGSMKTCWSEGWPVLLSQTQNKKRKYPHTLEMLHNGDSWIGINTSLTNQLVFEALNREMILELKQYEKISKEVKIGKSRIDFLLENQSETKHYVEVKNVTLKHGEYCTFPDSVSTRGQKHLIELISIAQMKNHKATLLFVVQREDVKAFKNIELYDLEYTKFLKEAKQQGVQILCYQCKLNSSEIKLAHKLDYIP